MIPGACHVSLG
ncbi:hypothetical protein E2C01_066291 [Portunus trituberculatus]|uniref:Uncharacterized protein n=1 Tax=Portunus trituberculatus TaxID=210409 RepID=A0A5B7HQJ3_PORTR|nr:hypothetical protein [Portunus trituberculatus]